MTFEDRPAPGFDYLLLLVVTAVITFAGLYYALLAEAPREKYFVYWLGGVILFCCALLAWSIYGAVRTEYRLNEEVLELRRGRKKFPVVLDTIEAILLVGTNWPALGISGLRTKNFCNRITDGIRLTTTNGKFYISPTNPHLFANHIRTMRFAGPPLPEFPPDEPEQPAGKAE